MVIKGDKLIITGKSEDVSSFMTQFNTLKNNIIKSKLPVVDLSKVYLQAFPNNIPNFFLDEYCDMEDPVLKPIIDL